jgi:hypothetical protein
MKLECYRQILEKKTQELYFLKILPVGAELFHVDGWTDGQTNITKVIVALCNCTKAYQKQNKHIKKDIEMMCERKVLCIQP